MCIQWNKMDLNIKRLSLITFTDLFLKKTVPLANSIFDIHKPEGIKLLTRLSLGLSHLNEDRYNEKFSTYFFRSDVESASHFF